MFVSSTIIKKVPIVKRVLSQGKKKKNIVTLKQHIGDMQFHIAANALNS